MLALDTQGCVYSWGVDKFGQLGHGWSEDDWEASRTGGKAPICYRPKLITEKLSSHEIAQIFAADKQSFAVTRQGKIFCWGKNENKMLGLKENVNEVIDEPKELDLSKMGGNACGSFSKVGQAKDDS